MRFLNEKYTILNKDVCNITNYNKQTDNSKPFQGTGSFGSRLEVLRSAQYSFKEHPLIGIGNGNYPNFIKKYVDSGLVGPVASQYSQAHNTFAEALISKGIIGLVLILLIFYYPVYIALKTRSKSYTSFVTISTYATALTLISLGESMLINKDNATAYLIFFSAVLFSSLMREVKNNEKSP